MLTFRSLLVLICLALSAPPALALDRAVRVIDGDTFVLDGRRIRLFGLDAPEQGQSCDRSGQSWRCGQWSARVLAELLARGPVTCTQQDRDRYGRSVAICDVNGTDLGASLVRAGAAIAYRRYSSRYLSAEAEARAANRGIWAGPVQSPEAFRHAAPAADPGQTCTIKGNIGRSGRIYHLPGQRDYAATRISPGKGEAWFCTEAEARAAGFRPARR